MFVRSIHIREFRHLRDIALGPFSEPGATSDAVALAGANGGGKSSILELLGYALSQSWSAGWGLTRTFPHFSFEVALGLSSAEVASVESYGKRVSGGAVLEYLPHLREERTLYRAFNYEGGKYAENSGLQNSLYYAASQGLQESGRSFGIFLKADRNYPTRGFQRERIFEFESTRTKAYAKNYAFSTSDAQYDDLYNFLAQQRYHYFAELGAHKFHGLNEPVPADPLAPYEALLGRLLPGYKFEQAGHIPTDLLVRLPSGSVLPFGDLSSGEKEVFFLLSSFLRHGVRDSIICVDEPELHLHPELGRILVQEMKRVAPSSQLWLATHNAEIIDEVGRDRVVYLSKSPDTGSAVLTQGVDEAESMLALRTLFGVSGYIGVARTMVFLEGEEASVDRKTYATLFPEAAGGLKFLPAGGASAQSRINHAILSLLEATFGVMKFYLIRDRDYMSDDMVSTLKNKNRGRIHILDRCHVENYLLDFEVIAKVMASVYDQENSADHWSERMREHARKLSGEVLRDLASYRMNLLVAPQDFSLGKLLAGQPLVSSGNEVVAHVKTVLQDRLEKRSQEISESMSVQLSHLSVATQLADWAAEVEGALRSHGWVRLFPGKRLISEFVKSESLGSEVAFINSILRTMAEMERQPNELSSLIQSALAGTEWD